MKKKQKNKRGTNRFFFKIISVLLILSAVISFGLIYYFEIIPITYLSVILILAGISFGLWSLEVLINYRGSFYYLLFESIIPFTVWTICAMIVFISIFYPLVFKFGVSKAMIIFAFVTVLSLSMDWFEENIETVFKFFTDQPDSGILLTILSLGGSYFLSRIIYSRKEF